MVTAYILVHVIRHNEFLALGSTNYPKAQGEHYVRTKGASDFRGGLLLLELHIHAGQHLRES